MDSQEFERRIGVKDPAGQSTGPATATPTQQPRVDSQEPQGEQQAPTIEVDPQPAQSLWDAVVQGFQGPGVQPEIINRNYSKEEGDALLTGMGVPAITGGMKSVFETKDFLFGDTPPEEQSPFRQKVEDVDRELKGAHPLIAGFSSAVGQFSVAMAGLGKLGYLARTLPWVGRGAAAVEGVKGGATAMEVGKAALAGAVAFDPHEERLSNFLQGTPLANPISEWLAAKPEDSDAFGRVKSAMESIGFDVAIISSLKMAGTVWKALRSGDETAARKAVEDFEKEREVAAKAEPEATAEPQQQQPEGNAPTATVNVEPSPVEYVRIGDGPNPSAPARAEAGTDGSSATAPTSPARDTSETSFKPTVQYTPDDLFGSKPAENGIGPTTRPGIMDDEVHYLENAEQDWDALVQQNAWGELFESSTRQGPDMGSFYLRYRTDNELLQMIDRGVVRKAEALDAAGFRVRQRDMDLRKQVETFAALANDNPSQLLGMLQQAGQEATTLTAKMIVAGSLTGAAFRDASVMATRFRYGDYTKYGSRGSMEEEIARRFTMATTLLKITDEIRSQGGRTLRANRGRPFDPSKFEDLSKDRFYALLEASKGDPRKLRTLADPNLLAKIMDTANYLRINSLISGWTTQAINIMGNGYMVGVRPLERILGSVPGAAIGSDPARTLLKENLRQYAYMGTELVDGFKTSVKAFMENESVLRPHGTELYANQPWQVPGSQAINASYFKPWDSVPNLIYNALSVPFTWRGFLLGRLAGWMSS